MPRLWKGRQNRAPWPGVSGGGGFSVARLSTNTDRAWSMTPAIQWSPDCKPSRVIKASAAPLWFSAVLNGSDVSPYAAKLAVAPGDDPRPHVPRAVLKLSIVIAGPHGSLLKEFSPRTTAGAVRPCRRIRRLAASIHRHASGDAGDMVSVLIHIARVRAEYGKCVTTCVTGSRSGV